MTAYFNEIDKFAAEWLRNLIDAGHLPDGVVDTRSIEDVHPSDLRGFTQCHFFAGIGVWSYALRRAGWADDRPVWTGSCPCQPFSAAGKGAGFADERHLWPAFHHLIEQCRPPNVFGEQVASSDAGHWIDLVQDDLEGLGYAFGAVPFPAASVGAPHIRDRLYWVANAESVGRGQECEDSSRSRVGDGAEGIAARFVDGGSCGGLGHTRHHPDPGQGAPASAGQPQADRSADQFGGSGFSSGGLGNANGQHTGRDCGDGAGAEAASDCGRSHDGAERYGADLAGGARYTGPTNGLWADADWLQCRDGKWRPVEPGTFPLVNGAPSRVGRLRAYGNAINAEAARVFIEAVMVAA